VKYPARIPLGNRLVDELVDRAGEALQATLAVLEKSSITKRQWPSSITVIGAAQRKWEPLPTPESALAQEVEKAVRRWHDTARRVLVRGAGRVTQFDKAARAIDAPSPATLTAATPRLPMCRSRTQAIRPLSGLPGADLPRQVALARVVGVGSGRGRQNARRGSGAGCRRC
jgi:hypothetical protein